MKPRNIKSRIFIDGGNPAETQEIIRELGFLDGQTTNPSLISQNPDAEKRIKSGKKFHKEELLNFYREVVQELARIMPGGSISIEVYADAATRAEHMLEQGRQMFFWIPNGQIKFPTTKEGLMAASQAVKEKIRVNMTLCFQQEQAAAVYAATAGAARGDVYVSPFVGRLDDRGENGMQLIENILRMYARGNGHVMVLTASVRTLDHLLYGLQLGSDIITAPFKILKQWAERGMPLPGKDYRYDVGKLKAIPYREIALTKNWQAYDLSHDLTDKGMEKFSEDWRSLLAAVPGREAA